MQIKRYIARAVPSSKTAGGSTETVTFNFSNGTTKDKQGNAFSIPSGETIIAGSVITSGSTFLVWRTFEITGARAVTVSISNLHTSELQLTLDIEVFTINGPDINVTW